MKKVVTPYRIAVTYALTDNKILSPFVTVRMRFLSVPHTVNVFHIR